LKVYDVWKRESPKEGKRRRKGTGTLKGTQRASNNDLKQVQLEDLAPQSGQVNKVEIDTIQKNKELALGTKNFRKIIKDTSVK